MDTNVRNFTIWKFVLFFIGMTIISVVVSIVFLQEADSMQAQRIIELLLNSSLALYIYVSIRKGKIAFNGQPMQQAMTRGRWAKYIGATLFLKAVGVIAVTIFGLLLLLAFPSIIHLVEAILTEEATLISTPTAFQFLLMVISLCILTPIWEEFFFRGILFRRFALRTKTTRAAIYSSLIFGVLHIGGNSIVHAFLVGILFCYIYASTQNIWIPVILHGLGNFLSILPNLFPAVPYEMTYLPSQDQLKGELITMSFPLLLCLVIGAILLKKYWPRLQKMTIVKEQEMQVEGMGIKNASEEIDTGKIE